MVCTRQIAALTNGCIEAEVIAIGSRPMNRSLDMRAPSNEARPDPDRGFEVDVLLFPGLRSYRIKPQNWVPVLLMSVLAE